jgi:hypothetical protein
MIRIGITGHRNLKTECISQYKQQVKELLTALKEEHKDILLYSSLAEGADRLVVEVGRSLMIDYIGVLPMDSDSYRLDFTCVSKREFDNFLMHATSMIEMQWLNKPSKFLNSSDRDAQYEAAGYYIANECDILIALWDGMQSCLRGGTSETVNYFVQKKNAILYHIPISRE